VIAWADKMTREWLATGMFHGANDAAAKTYRIVQELGSHAITLSHSRHISIDAALSLGLNVTRLEDDQRLQDAVLSVHHAAIISLNMTPAIKIIENDVGIAQITSGQQLFLMSKPG